jgi:hypothetical protein
MRQAGKLPLGPQREDRELGFPSRWFAFSAIRAAFSQEARSGRVFESANTAFNISPLGLPAHRRFSKSLVGAPISITICLSVSGAGSNPDLFFARITLDESSAAKALALRRSEEAVQSMTPMVAAKGSR